MSKQVRLDKETSEILSQGGLKGDLYTLPKNLDRNAYLKVDKALKALGAKWNRKRGGHVVGSDFAARLAESLDDGVAVNKDKVLSFFRTPSAVASQVLELADIWDDHAVLEPSAGDGALVDITHGEWTLVEVDEGRANHLRETYPDADVILADFLTYRTSNKFDRIVMNPPWDKRIEEKHVLHALKLLTPDGILVAVLPSGVEHRKTKSSLKFREVVEELGGVFHDLPEDSFRESGTRVNSCMLVIDRT